MTTIEQDLQALIARAAVEGHVATISLLSAWPPAMGAYSMVGEVRPARGCPEGMKSALARAVGDLVTPAMTNQDAACLYCFNGEATGSGMPVSSQQLSKAAEASDEGSKIDANALERMAKERPDEMFLKGTGVLKLIGAIRQLEGELRALRPAQPVGAAPVQEPPDYLNATGKDIWQIGFNTALSLAAPVRAVEQPTGLGHKSEFCYELGLVSDWVRMWGKSGVSRAPAIHSALNRIEAAYLAAPKAAEPSDAMVDAYLTAQRATVEEADKFGRPNIGGLHTNTVREACRAGLAAALTAAGKGGAK